MIRTAQGLALAPWHLALLALSLIYGLSVRNQVTVFSNDVMLPVNMWDQVIRFALDPYYLSYCLVPIWLFSTCTAISRDFSWPSLIRLGSYRMWLFKSSLHALPRMSPLLLIWLVATFTTAFGLPLSADWSRASGAASPMNQVLGIVSAQGPAPILALALQIALVGIAFLCCHVLLAAVYLMVPRQFSVYTAAAVIYLGQIFSFRRPIEAAPFLDLANFLMLHRSLEAYQPVVLVFLPLAAVILLCFGLAGYKDRRQLLQLRRRRPAALLVYAALCVLGPAYAGIFKLQGSVDAPLDVLFVAFYGVSAAGFEWNLYMYHSIVFLGFAYLFLLALDNELKARIYYVVLRHGSTMKWLSRFLTPFAGWSMLLLGVLFIGALLSWTMGRSGTNSPGIEPNIGLLLYQFFVNGTLQLLCYILLFFLVGWLSGQSMAGLFALAGLLVAGLPSVNVYRVLPAALNSLGYVELGGGELLRITGVLILYIICLLTAAFLIVKKPKLFFNRKV
jgi:hypothetical protein